MLTLLLSFAGLNSASAQSDGHANSKAMVTEGDVRFTVLTPGMLRLEWDSSRKFNGQFTVDHYKRSLVIDTWITSTRGMTLRGGSCQYA